MIQFLLRKFLRVTIVLVGVTLITFLLMHAIPGNPWNNYSSSVHKLQRPETKTRAAPENPAQPSSSIPSTRPGYLRMPQPTGPQDEAGAGPVLPPLAVPNRLNAFTTWSLPQVGQMIVSLVNIERRYLSNSASHSPQWYS